MKSRLDILGTMWSAVVFQMWFKIFSNVRPQRLLSHVQVQKLSNEGCVHFITLIIRSPSFITRLSFPVSVLFAFIFLFLLDVIAEAEITVKSSCEQVSTFVVFVVLLLFFWIFPSDITSLWSECQTASHIQ